MVVICVLMNKMFGKRNEKSKNNAHKSKSRFVLQLAGQEDGDCTYLFPGEGQLCLVCKQSWVDNLMVGGGWARLLIYKTQTLYSQ